MRPASQPEIKCKKVGAQSSGLLPGEMLPKKLDQPKCGISVMIQQLQLVHENECHIVRSAVCRIDARRKIGIIGIPVDRVGENASDLRDTHVVSDQTCRMFPDLAK